MNNNTINPNEKVEIIERALQEAIGGAGDPIDLCGFTCSVFSRDVCRIDLCRISF